jgi:radical SAM protein with 4Fe4S-binding SPASM domain
MDMRQEDIYVFNPDYFLKLDKNRVLITRRSSDPRISDFSGFVHPVYAILLSLFDGEKELGRVITAAASILKKESAIISNIISPLLENEKTLYFHFDGRDFSFPARLLVRKSNGYPYEKLNPESFFIPKKDLDFDTWRLNTPLDALFIINTRCVTDCVYCYADRRRSMDCEIPIDRLKELIQEARELQMRYINISGGELFLYKHWEVLLSELLTNGLVPYISTKCPINERTINKLKDMGLKKIQVSIDSIMPEELTRMLRVKPDYSVRLMETLKNLDEKGFEIFTNTQITSTNDGNISQLLDFLLSLKNIKRINMGAAAFSLYLGESKFKEYRANLEKLEQLKMRLEDLKKQYWGDITINFSGYSDKNGVIDKAPEEKKKSFGERARCSGNFYSFTILPDGKVTICEELYWHPKFIIGDLSKQSIKEVWNSKPALELYNISRDMIKDESPCKTCPEFDPCHKTKGVCWKEVLYAYGEENWDYPDPKCPYAVKPIREYYFS